jgi:hypothetical protein
MKIKNFLLSVVVFMALTIRAFSQDNFTEGTNMINFGIGFGNLYYRGFAAGYDFSSTPALTISLDHSFKKIEEIEGTIGIGGLVGFESSSSRYNNSFGYYKYHWNNFILAPRVSYHAGFINTDKFDLYGGIMLGVRIESVTYTSNYGAPDLGNYGGLVFTGGGFIGGAYYFVNNLGAFAELGYDISYLKIGLTLKTGIGKK